MFESNFTVRKRWCGYQVCWNTFKRLAAGASVAEKRDLFAGAAARAYRMDYPDLSIHASRFRVYSSGSVENMSG